MNTDSILSPSQPARYRLCLQGRITTDWTDWLSDLAVDYQSNGAGVITSITGTVSDQAALFGCLSFVRDLGVPLLSVELVQIL